MVTLGSAPTASHLSPFHTALNPRLSALLAWVCDVHIVTDPGPFQVGQQLWGYPLKNDLTQA